MEIGSYSWFREHGHTRLHAFRRSMDYKFSMLLPIPRHGPPEENIENVLEGLNKLITTISKEDYYPDESLPERHAPERQIEELYEILQKIPKEYFNERTNKEFHGIEMCVWELQQKGKL